MLNRHILTSTSAFPAGILALALAATALELGMELATLNPGFRTVPGLRLVY